jgi:hypothetical protein
MTAATNPSAAMASSWDAAVSPWVAALGNASEGKMPRWSNLFTHCLHSPAFPALPFI